MLRIWLAIAITTAYGNDFKRHDPRYCLYWLTHLDEVIQHEERLIEARQSLNPWSTWVAKRRLKRKFRECEWQTYDCDTFETELPDLEDPNEDEWKNFRR